jgi:hypothetical protein
LRRAAAKAVATDGEPSGFSAAADSAARWAMRDRPSKVLPHGANAIPPAKGSKGEAPTAPAHEAFTPDLLNFAISPASGRSGDFHDISLC